MWTFAKHQSETSDTPGQDSKKCDSTGKNVGVYQNCDSTYNYIA